MYSVEHGILTEHQNKLSQLCIIILYLVIDFQSLSPVFGKTHLSTCNFSGLMNVIYQNEM
jgi:hypothetical protein